ncbi:hypothetical protein [Nannocystis pusilla]|uniref:hypothetical protein n=1 Tax=Nannocystis pusilla TaxID=889268 RepID=UPI003B790306
MFVSGQTRKFLELAPGAAGINVLEMASKELRPHLHVLLREATSKRQERIQRGVSLPVDGRIQPVDIVVRPLLELGADSDLYAVIFYEAGTSLSPEQAEAEGRAPQSATRTPSRSRPSCAARGRTCRRRSRSSRSRTRS